MSQRTRTIEVHPPRLFAQTSHARMMADHGIGLARNGGTVRSISGEYGLTCRTLEPPACDYCPGTAERHRPGCPVPGQMAAADELIRTLDAGA